MLGLRNGSDLRLQRSLCSGGRSRRRCGSCVTPEKSNRAIAAEIDVSEATVRRARASYDAPAAVTGRDGKQYPTRAPTPIDWSEHRCGTKDLGAVQAMVTREEGTDDQRRTAIRQLSYQLCARLRDAGNSSIADVIRTRKDPAAQDAAYKAASKILLELACLLELARTAP